MKTANFSRAIAENLPFVVGPNDWLISIFSSKGTPPNITADFGRVLHLQFDDVNEDEAKCGFKPIDSFQVDVLKDFIILARERSANLWVHCDAGACRSTDALGGDQIVVVSFGTASIRLGPGDWTTYKLPKIAQRAYEKYDKTGEMKPFEFELGVWPPD